VLGEADGDGRVHSDMVPQILLAGNKSQWREVGRRLVYIDF